MAIYVNVIGKNQRVVSLKNYVSDVGHLYCGDILFLGYGMDFNSGENYISFTSKYLPVSSNLGTITNSADSFVKGGVTYNSPVYRIPIEYEFSENPEDFIITVDENTVNNNFPNIPTTIEIVISRFSNKPGSFWYNDIIYIPSYDLSSAITTVNIISKYKITSVDSMADINVSNKLYYNKYACKEVSRMGEMFDFTLVLDTSEIMSNWTEFYQGESL